jgi:hypothetical protein
MAKHFAAERLAAHDQRTVQKLRFAGSSGYVSGLLQRENPLDPEGFAGRQGLRECDRRTTARRDPRHCERHIVPTRLGLGKRLRGRSTGQNRSSCDERTSHGKAGER